MKEPKWFCYRLTHSTPSKIHQLNFSGLGVLGKNFQREREEIAEEEIAAFLYSTSFM